MSNDIPYAPEDANTIRELIAKIRKGQVWKKDIAKGVAVNPNTTIDMWLNATNLAPGPYKTKASIVYRNYAEFCKEKKINDNHIIASNKFGEIVKKERLFPYHVADSSRHAFYGINKDILSDEDREKEKIKKEKRKASKKKSIMGIKAPDVQ